jgi:peptidoglycan/xylan/chitin deacetylase (PgdA/CDA1 family)
MRLLTFRFDDGFWLGTQKAIELLRPYKGSFFVVGDRVLGVSHVGDNPLLAGRDFGSLDGWRALAESGQDIQPHGYAHRRLSDMSPSEAEDDIRRSVDVVRLIAEGPYVLSCPFNALIPQLGFAELGLSAVGFESRTSAEPVLFNSLRELDFFKLRSWAIRESHLAFVESQIASIPGDSWTVLGLHSLDGEGYEPWSTQAFTNLLSHVTVCGFDIVTAKDVVRRFGSCLQGIDAGQSG